MPRLKRFKESYLLKRIDPIIPASGFTALALLLVILWTPLAWAADPTPAVPAPAPTSGNIQKADSSSDNITLDFKEADINTVLRVMSIKSNVNIVAGPEVQGTVTIRLENVPWEKKWNRLLKWPVKKPKKI